MTDTNLDNNSESSPGTQLTTPKRQLPNIDDLYSDRGLAELHNELNILLNQPPKPQWLKFHPVIKIKQPDGNGGEVTVQMPYIPIERIEWLLTAIFIEWETEIKEIKQLANAVVVTVTLKVLHPITGKWKCFDGVGAMDIQTKKGASAADLAQIVPSAIQKAAPAAESYAIKDAAEKLGKIFGKDLTRFDEIGYQMLDSKFSEPLNK